VGTSDDPPTLVFSLPGLQNPRSLKQTGSFVISLYDSNSLLFQTNISIPVQMTSVSKTKSVNITRGSYINGMVTNYTFKIVGNSDV
jgi:hypothetical protein